MTRVGSSRRTRAGITLTEILISILIMGVGMVSLATLFPIGLQRIRAAQRNVRSAQMTRAASADVGSRNMFGRPDLNYWYGTRDPFVLDTLPAGAPAGSQPVSSGLGPAGFVPGMGLPVAFDPLWWAQVGATDPSLDPTTTEVRFGSGYNAGMRLDNDGADPAAHGLQRLTTAEFLNPFSQLMGGNLAQIQLLRNQDVGHASGVFASIDDPVLQAEGPVTNETVNSGAVDVVTTVKGSPVLPMLEVTQDSGTGAILSTQTFNDWAYSWMFTGRRSGINSRTYAGDIVVFHNRPFAVENVGTGIPSAAGERVVEAIFGYGTTVTDFVTSTTGYSPQTRSVLLRWPAGQPDPVVKRGQWIADVTYERLAARYISRFYGQRYPGQRCHWYRVTKTSDIEDDTTLGGFRRMIVSTEQPMQSRTLVFYNDPSGADGEPVHINAALLSPYVVNVFPRVFGAY